MSGLGCGFRCVQGLGLRTQGLPPPSLMNYRPPNNKTATPQPQMTETELETKTVVAETTISVQIPANSDKICREWLSYLQRALSCSQNAGTTCTHVSTKRSKETSNMSVEIHRECRQGSMGRDRAKRIRIF
eukprot:1740383-Rhodomonas_salina.1